MSNRRQPILYYSDHRLTVCQSSLNLFMFIPVDIAAILKPHSGHSANTGGKLHVLKPVYIEVNIRLSHFLHKVPSTTSIGFDHGGPKLSQGATPSNLLRTRSYIVFMLVLPANRVSSSINLILSYSIPWRQHSLVSTASC